MNKRSHHRKPKKTHPWRKALWVSKSVEYVLNKALNLKQCKHFGKVKIA